MNGRQEHSLEIETKIKNTLTEWGSTVNGYYISMADKTPKTKQAYINYVCEFLKSLDKNYLEVKRSDIAAYMEQIRYRTLKDGTIKENGASIRRVKLAAIKGFYEYLVDEELIEKNPCDHVRLPSVNTDKEIVAMTPDEISELKANIRTSHRKTRRERDWGKRDLAIVAIGCTTGLRVTALTEINISDIDMEHGSIEVVEKGNKRRTVYFGENTKNAIQAWLNVRDKYNKKGSDALFISNRGTRISVRTIQSIIEKQTSNFSKHITPHKMRSSCATNLYERTHDIYLVQNVLGHSNIANTRRYAKLSENGKREAASILDHLS